MQQTSNPESTGVTLVIRRRVKPGKEQDYEDWITSVSQEAQEKATGFLGADLHRPASPSREYKIIFRFATLEDLEQFEHAEWRLKRMQEVPPLVDGDAVWDRLTGLELWFDPPPGTPIPKPNPLRMALVLIVVVFTLVQVIGGLVALVIPGWPEIVRMLITITIEVLIMTYFVMPAISRHLATWIYKK